MNWAAWGPTIVAVLTAVFIYGKMAGRIEDQELTIKQQDSLVRDHEKRITSLEAWQVGYTAGKNDALKNAHRGA